MSEYKFTANLSEGQNNYGNYTQYIDLRESYNKQKEIKGVSLGIPGPIDAEFKIIPGITVIAGMTGHGKSMFGNSIAYKAVKDGLNVVYITLEVSKENIFYQMISIKSFIEYPRESDWISHSIIKRRELTPTQESKVFDEIWPAFKEMKGNLYILTEWDFDTGSTASLQSKLMEIEDYSINQTGKGVDLLIVDYIQLFKEYKESNNYGEYSIITQWVNDFRKMSLNYLGENRELPIVLLAQLNRDAWNDEKEKYKKIEKNKSIDKYNLEIEMNDDMPCKPKKRKHCIVPQIALSISQIAGCSEIAKAAKQIIVIYLDESLKVSNQCQIQVIKNRDGDTKMEPVLTYINPVYYYVGTSPVKSETCNLNLAQVLDFEDLPHGTL